MDHMLRWCLSMIRSNICSCGNPRDGVLKLPWHPPYNCFIQGQTCFVGFGSSLYKQSVAVWIVLDGAQDYETKCASLMSDGKSWKTH